ncbi:MAG: 23S rRNA (guanosine(2251)-2'-O)-methyltransferase RlmB [Actinomycetota bacterium]
MAAEDRVLAGRRPIVELLRAGGTAERVFIAQGLAPSKVIDEIRTRAARAAIPVRDVPKNEIDRMAAGLHHQGAVALTGRWRYTPLDELLTVPDVKLLFLDGVTDPHNLGSLLRTADGAGFHGVVVPSHRSVGVTPAVRRVSAGAAEVVPVARVSSLVTSLDEVRGAGVWIVGLDAGASEDIWSSTLPEPPVGLVLGGEEKGISRGVRGRCDGLVRIPLEGALESLNVAVAGAIAMFEVARRSAQSATL